MSDPRPLDEVQVGARYVVEWDDCCTEGQFDSAVVSVNPSADGTVAVESVTFENGVTIGGWAVSVELVVPGG